MEVSFTELDEISLKVEAVRSLMTGLEYGIFESPEVKETFRTGYMKLTEELYEIEKEIKDLVEKMSLRVKLKTVKEVA